MTTPTKSVPARIITIPEGCAEADLARWLYAITRCHGALASYGAQRLEPAGWRELGIGSLPAASPGFRALALTIAVDWATYEARDTWDQTVAQIAARQPHWFDPALRSPIDALAASRLDLYTVDASTAPLTVLRRVRDGRRFIIHALIDDRVLPPTRQLVARLAIHDGAAILLSSTVLDRSSAHRAVRGPAPTTADEWSRRLLDAALRQFEAVDLAGRGTARTPMLVGRPLAELARLQRAVRALEIVLDRQPGSMMLHHDVEGSTLCAQRHGRRWRIEIAGRVLGAVERIPCEAAHPVDAEIMRQIGGTPSDGVLAVEGEVQRVIAMCAAATVGRSARAAA